MGKNTVVIDKNELEELKKVAHDLAEENAQLRQKLDHMNELLLNAQRARFGQSSERTKYVMQGGTQLGLFNEAEAEQDHKAVEPTENTIVISKHTRKAKRTVDELTANLPVKEVLITLSDDELICDKCGGKYEMIGKKLVSRRLEVIPRQCYVVEYYSCSYACKNCETKTGYANIVTTVTPPMLMKHSLASASTVANVMTQKYVDGLPLARQEKIWEREGICLSRALSLIHI